MKAYCIYLLKFIDGSKYIGMTSQLPQRILRYKQMTIPRQKRLLAKLKELGNSSFVVEVIAGGLGKEQARVKEKIWIELLDTCSNGLNTIDGRGSNGNTEYKARRCEIAKENMEDTEFKRKSILALKSNEEKRKASLRTPAVREKISKAQKARLAKNGSHQSIAIISNDKKTKFRSIKDFAMFVGKNYRGAKGMIDRQEKFMGKVYNYLEDK